MLLTQRAEDIIRVLIRFPQDNPVTTAIISEELNISSRSIQRELPGVEQWLAAEGYHFVRKRSVGLLLDEPEERRQELLALLDHNKSANVTVDDRRDRQRILCHEILFAAEPVKSYYFTDKFGISDGTLASDLNQIEPWFEKYHLTLVRRQGLGIFLKGSEIARRQAVTSHICSQLSQKRHPESMQSSNNSRQGIYIREIPRNITSNVTQVLTEGEHKLHLHLSDNGYLHLLAYISYTVYRIQNGFIIENTEITDSDLSMEPEFAVAEYLMRQLRQDFKLPILDAETRYLTIFLTGIRIWPSSRRDLTTQRDFDVHQITLTLIKNVGEVLGIDFSDDSRLPSELGAHIQPTIGRLRAGIPIENPLLGDFRASYREVFQACETGCQVLSEMYELPLFPESEIGFITIYFVMAMDRKAKLARRISVIIVCPTGIGSSRLLSESLKKEYPDLDIRGTMSAFDIDSSKLASDGIDLIISTVKLDTTYRWINVNPILTKQDKMLLDSKMKLILSQKKNQNKSAKIIPAAPLSKEDVDYISSLGEGIYQLLGNIRIGQAPVLHSRDEIISHAASLFADSPEIEQHFYEIMKKRDMIADTYMKPFHALLLHGKSPDITHPCFGYIHLEPPIYENARIILGAIVSFIPEDPKDKISAPIASEIIGALLEEPELLKALRNTDDELFTSLLEVSLLKFYKNRAASRLGLPNK
ncbi:MAG: BglG family transcription antiterminator [Eubacteriales bacterium]|nr:BglG family transcription antiterminator [Eubacteriales bacterium]